MVSSKGVVRLIELIIALVIIMTMLLIAYKKTQIDYSENDLGEIARDILREVASNESLRNEIVSAQTNIALIPNTMSFINNSLPDYLLFELVSCESGGSCGQSAYKGEVYSAERIFGATSTSFNTVKLRLFIWTGE